MPISDTGSIWIMREENSALSFLSCHVPDFFFLCGGKKDSPPLLPLLHLGVCTIHGLADQLVT